MKDRSYFARIDLWTDFGENIVEHLAGAEQNGSQNCDPFGPALRNGTVAPVPACFLRGESHEERRSSEGTLTEEHRQYWGCGLRPATGRAAFQG
jgi:hypothetical protein